MLSKFVYFAGQNKHLKRHEIHQGALNICFLVCILVHSHQPKEEESSANGCKCSCLDCTSCSFSRSNRSWGRLRWIRIRVAAHVVLTLSWTTEFTEPKILKLHVMIREIIFEQWYIMIKSIWDIRKYMYSICHTSHPLWFIQGNWLYCSKYFFSQHNDPQHPLSLGHFSASSSMPQSSG
jgi:hypothetical protein